MDNKTTEQVEEKITANEVTKALAEWSLKYPRSQVYGMSKMSMDDELVKIEEMAKVWLKASTSSPDTGKGLRWVKLSNGVPDSGLGLPVYLKGYNKSVNKAFIEKNYVESQNCFFIFLLDLEGSVMAQYREGHHELEYIEWLDESVKPVGDVMRWVKASERTPEKSAKLLNMKIANQADVGYFDGSYFITKDDDYLPESKIEWLEENVKPVEGDELMNDPFIKKHLARIKQLTKEAKEKLEKPDK